MTRFSLLAHMIESMWYLKLINIKHVRRTCFHNPCCFVTDYIKLYENNDDKRWLVEVSLTMLNEMLHFLQAAASESDMALALNRYLCTAVLPLLLKHSHFFRESEHMSVLLETMLQTCYRLSKCRTLTKGQQEISSDFLVSFTQWVNFFN